MVRVLLFVTLFSCTNLRIYPEKKKITSYGQNEVTLISHNNKTLKLMESDLIKLYSMISNNKNFLSVLSLVQRIDHAPNHCRVDEYACVSSAHIGVVYLTPLYFKLNQAMRLGTLIHEASHFKYSLEHVRCQKRSGHECDQTIDSSYGLELTFMEQFYPDQKGVIKSLKARINKLSK